MTRSRWLVRLMLVVPPSLMAQSAEQVPAYVPSQQVSGTIRICGSPQMGDLLKRYEEGFHRLQPNVQFAGDLRSTITAVAGVYTDRADIGLLGREIWATEAQAFTSSEGHAPTVIDVATGSYDVPKATFALMVFVPQSNPIASLTTAQLERLFSNTSDHPIRTWGELGLTGAWASRRVHLYGFRVDNDKSMIVSQLLFKPGVHWNPSMHESVNAGAVDAGEAIVRAVAADPDGIGISNVHYAVPNVRALPLSTAAHPLPVTPSRDTVASRLYPLTRAVYMVVNVDTSHPLSPSISEFLRFVLSRQGQQAIIEEGNYLPLPPDVAAGQLLLLK